MDDGDKTQNDKIDDDNSDENSLIGSYGAQLGGESEYLCDQFQIHSPVMKKHQIVLLEVYTMIPPVLNPQC